MKFFFIILAITLLSTNSAVGGGCASCLKSGEASEEQPFNQGGVFDTKSLDKRKSTLPLTCSQYHSPNVYHHEKIFLHMGDNDFEKVNKTKHSYTDKSENKSYIVYKKKTYYITNCVEVRKPATDSLSLIQLYFATSNKDDDRLTYFVLYLDYQGISGQSAFEKQDKKPSHQ